MDRIKVPRDTWNRWVDDNHTVIFHETVPHSSVTYKWDIFQAEIR